MEWEGSIVRGSSALKRLEEERLGQLANQAKQYITLMEEYRYIKRLGQLANQAKQYITLMEEYKYITFIEKKRYKTLMEKYRNITLIEEYLHKLISLSFNSLRSGFGL